MKNTESVFKCDVCGKRETFDPEEMRIGGHPLHGWFHVDRTNGSTSLVELRKPHKWDVCCKACLAKLAASL